MQTIELIKHNIRVILSSSAFRHFQPASKNPMDIEGTVLYIAMPKTHIKFYADPQNLIKLFCYNPICIATLVIRWDNDQKGAYRSDHLTMRSNNINYYSSIWGDDNDIKLRIDSRPWKLLRPMTTYRKHINKKNTLPRGIKLKNIQIDDKKVTIDYEDEEQQDLVKEMDGELYTFDSNKRFKKRLRNDILPESKLRVMKYPYEPHVAPIDKDRGIKTMDLINKGKIFKSIINSVVEEQPEVTNIPKRHKKRREASVNSSYIKWSTGNNYISTPSYISLSDNE